MMSIVSFVAAAHMAVVTSGPHRTLDLRVHSEPDGADYSLSVCTRPSPGSTKLPGHAFVGYSRLPRLGGREYLAVGHTSNAGLGAIILTYLGIKPAVDGSIQDEIYTSTQEQCLVLLVNRADHQTALEAARDVVSGTLPSFTPTRHTILRYTLGSQDCVGFVLRVLEPFRSAGKVRVPSRAATELPLPYLRRIIDAIRGHCLSGTRPRIWPGRHRHRSALPTPAAPLRTS